MSVLLASLALGAIGASAAQALDWGVAETEAPYVLSGTSSEPIAGSGWLVISANVGGVEVELECESSTTAGSIKAGGSGTESIALSGCAVTPANCELSPVSLEAKTELIQVGGTTYEKFVPAKGSSFAELELSGAGCAFNELGIPLTGAFAGRPTQGGRVVERTLAFSPTINSSAGVQVKLGNSSALFYGGIQDHLSGAPVGSSWRSLWEGTHGAWEIQEVVPHGLEGPESVAVSGGPVEFGFVVGGATISVNCTGSSASGAYLFPGGTEKASQLSLTGCTVTKPSNCSIPGNSITFNSVVGSLESIGGSYYETFKAGAASGAFFALRFEGNTCTLAENEYVVKGSFTGLGSGYGAPSISQSLAFSKASNKAAGSGLSIGGYASGWLSGTMGQQFAGVLTGSEWEVF